MKKDWNNIKQTKMKNLDLLNDKYYFLCGAGLGDTLLTCGFLDELKKKYGDIVLLIKPSHEVIMKMYEIKDYQALDFTFEDAKFLGKKCQTPQKGMIYPIHPAFHNDLWDFFKPMYYHNLEGFFMDWFKEFLGVDKNVEFTPPKSYPEISQELMQKLDKPLEKTVLCVPDATSVKPIKKEYWTSLVQKLKNEGFFIICNVVKEEDALPDTKFLNLSLEDAVALALKCHHVYSLRNGLCDLIYSKGEDLTVLYPNHNTYAISSLNKMFKRSDIDEQIVLTLSKRDKFYKLFGINVLSIEKVGYTTIIKLFGKTIYEKSERL